MNATKICRPRGRPRSFDEGAAVATAQALFQAHGYDGVGVAELSAAIGVNPPSLYGAFGSKSGLFARAMERYASTEAQYMTAALSAPDLPALATRALEGAARTYAAQSPCSGCLAIETARSASEPEVRAEGLARVERFRAELAARIRREAPGAAEGLADYLVVALAGLSAAARIGTPPAGLRAAAAIALRGFLAALAQDRTG